MWEEGEDQSPQRIFRALMESNFYRSSWEGLINEFTFKRAHPHVAGVISDLRPRSLQQILFPSRCTSHMVSDRQQQSQAGRTGRESGSTEKPSREQAQRPSWSNQPAAVTVKRPIRSLDVSGRFPGRGHVIAARSPRSGHTSTELL
ncbi:unnamed protein product [Pleuronectes platessa]|uniref:Uncharacterized protein n=1 Tax=Pleuronectes platessa TaxID=8262 RepID=A0A9N7YJF8_PLEPL|nr:unnamed protein product [Pleuronectes platessa]